MMKCVNKLNRSPSLSSQRHDISSFSYIRLNQSSYFFLLRLFHLSLISSIPIFFSLPVSCLILPLPVYLSSLPFPSFPIFLVSPPSSFFSYPFLPLSFLISFRAPVFFPLSFFSLFLLSPPFFLFSYLFLLFFSSSSYFLPSHLYFIFFFLLFHLSSPPFLLPSLVPFFFQPLSFFLPSATLLRFPRLLSSE